METLIDKLEAFGRIADAWFEEKTESRENYLFFKQFFTHDRLQRAEWPDFQAMGKHLYAFGNAQARMNALGKRLNHPIQQYRDVFLALTDDSRPVEERVREFLDRKQVDFKYFGFSARTEIVGYLFGDRYMMYNARTRSALEDLKVDGVLSVRGTNSERFFAFNVAAQPIVEEYTRVVGNRSDLPIHLQVDQFFYWLDSQINKKTPRPEIVDPPPVDYSDYGVEQAIQEIFLPRDRLEEMLDLLRFKKNVVLQGPPGVGKTFVAKRLGYLLLGKRDDRGIAMVQFHQSYGYEDFIQGFRPAGEGFNLRDGPFFRFCETARKDPTLPHVFIIDEINRGNLSKILGELMLLIEVDKRDQTWAVPLTYSAEGAAPFFVPKNVYLIGTMNTADRSLAMVDYALRRRFVFVNLDPAFDNSAFIRHLTNIGVEGSLIQTIVHRLQALNERIANDAKNLGPGFCIGHSYFCQEGDGFIRDGGWFKRIVRTEIKPLLEEYWFDDRERAESEVHELLVGL